MTFMCLMTMAVVGQAVLHESIFFQWRYAMDTEELMEVGGPLWTAQDVADYLKCSKSFIYKLAEAGKLKSLRIGALLRFDRTTVRAFAGIASTQPTGA